jgi:Tfp pilus assembly protein PilF
MMAYRNGDDPTFGEELLEQAAQDRQLNGRQLAEIAFYRGIAARTRGDEDGARAAFARALATDPSFKPALIAQMA